LKIAASVSVSPPEDIRERAFRFTCDLFDYCEELATLPGMARRVAYQLFDAGGSVLLRESDELVAILTATSGDFKSNKSQVSRLK